MILQPKQTLSLVNVTYHILLSFTATLCVYRASHSPSVSAQFTAEQLVLWGWAYNCNSKPSNSSLLIIKAQHWFYLGSEPKQHSPEALGQVFTDCLNDRHLYITTLQA